MLNSYSSVSWFKKSLLSSIVETNLDELLLINLVPNTQAWPFLQNGEEGLHLSMDSREMKWLWGLPPI